MTAKVVDGQFAQIVYTVEKSGGAWAEVVIEDVQQLEDLPPR